jgi:hypothetical protein
MVGIWSGSSLMQKAVCALLVAIATVFSSTAAAQEIVVTATRYADRYEDLARPHVAIVRRADAVVATARIESDSRSLSDRSAELQRTLEAFERRARASQTVSVGLLEEGDAAGETWVSPFVVERAMERAAGGGRVDTSAVTVLLRTPVQPNESLDAAYGRLTSFAEGAPHPERVTIDVGSAQLTVVDPEQYRAALIAAIGAEVRAVLAEVGPGHASAIEGLESRVVWRRTNELELTLFIPHRLRIVPAGG